MTGHGWPKYAKDESGDDSSDSYAEAFRNEGLDVEGLGVGKIQGDQEHDTAEHAKKRVRRTGALNQGDQSAIGFSTSSDANFTGRCPAGLTAWQIRVR